MKYLTQLKEMRGAAGTLLAAVLVGALLATWVGLPAQVTSNQEEIQSIAERQDQHERDFRQFVDRFDRFLCIRRAELDETSAQHCNRGDNEPRIP